MKSKPESTMKLRPLHDFVLVKRFIEDEKSQGGIILPDQSRAKSERGEVLAVGPGRFADNGKRLEPCVKRGDVVWLPRYGGQAVGPNDRGPETILLRESELLGVES